MKAAWGKKVGNHCCRTPGNFYKCYCLIIKPHHSITYVTRPAVTDRVAWSVDLSVTVVNPAKTVEGTRCRALIFSERELTFTFAMLSPARLASVVGNARAPYSGGYNFRQYFYGIWYLGHPLTSTKDFTEIVSLKGTTPSRS